MKPRTTPLLLAVLLGLSGAPLSGQEDASGQEATAAMMEAYEKAGTPGAPHEALAATAGEWKTTVKMWMDPAADPMVMEGTATIRPILGGRYVQEDVKGTFMGKPFRGIAITGYDNLTGEAQAIWIDDHSTTLYRYSGTISADGKRITLEGKHLDPASGEWIEGRSVRKVVSADRIVETGWERHEGAERKVMEIVYQRTGG